jgi:WD40-like Beta Propeller Repeat
VRENTLLAQPFDPNRQELSGDPVPVAERVQYDQGFFTAVFSISENGVLAYQADSGSTNLSQLVWLDRSGKRVGTVGAPADYWIPRLSHDGRRVAVTIDDPGDVWTFDLSRGVSSRFTFDPADDTTGVWSPDDARIAFTSLRKGAGDIYQKTTTGTGTDGTLVTSGALKFATDWSADGRFLAFMTVGGPGRSDIWILSLADGKTTPYLSTEFDESDAQFSPDGRWMAFSSDESGKLEVYVQSFPGPGGKWQISTSGGAAPKWRRDGKEIFYLAPDGKLMAVDVQAAATFEVGVPKALFDTRCKKAPTREYDVSSDGQRFLVNQALGETTATPITLIQNWSAGLPR